MLMLITLVVELSLILQMKWSGTISDLPIPNGQSFPLLLFHDIPYLMVIFSAIFIADIWVDEYRNGAFKLTLTRPVGRITFLNAKVISYFICCILMMTFVLVSSYIIGSVTFGWGESAIIGSEKYSVFAGIALTLKSGAVTLIPVFGFGLMVMFIGLCTDSMGTTIGMALGLLVASQMLEVSEAYRDYSVIYLMEAFYKNLFFSFSWDTVLKNIAVIASYVVFFYTGSLILFKKKNIVR
jgi:ABC-type transport system involved in multi-copper enzyme maturation permease subunit